MSLVCHCKLSCDPHSSASLSTKRENGWMEIKFIWRMHTFSEIIFLIWGWLLFSIYYIDLYSPNEVWQIFTQITVVWIENKLLNDTVGFWWDSQSQKPVQFELKVDGPFIGGLVVACHYGGEVGNKCAVLFKQSQLLSVLLSVACRTVVVERCKIW